MQSIRLLLAVTALLTIPSCDSGGGLGPRWCTAIGCSDGVTVRLPKSLSNADFEVCHNAMCVTEHFDGSYLTYRDVDFAFDASSFGATSTEVTIWRPKSLLADGDVFRIRVTIDGARALTATSAPTTYHSHFPNGEACDDGCRVGDTTWSFVNGCTAGECAPGAIEESTCPSSGVRTKTCSYACAWTVPSECGRWTKIAAPPSSIEPRSGHRAVWTGTEMIVAGGAVESIGAYDPVKDTWRVLPSDKRANAREIVWTGASLVTFDVAPAELALDTATPVWRDLPAPPTALWYPVLVFAPSTNEVIAWGSPPPPDVGTGTRGVAWSTTARTWRTIAPSPYPLGHLAAFDGSRMVVLDASVAATEKAAAYDPVTDEWHTLPEVPGMPSPTAAGATSGVVWLRGGTHGRDPVSGQWLPAGASAWRPIEAEALPLGLVSPTALVSPTEVFVLGTSERAPTGSFASWSPGSERWNALPTPPAPRPGATAVWAKDRVIVWGGESATDGPQAEGWAFTP